MKNFLIEPLEARIAPATFTIAALQPQGVLEGDSTSGVATFRITLSEVSEDAVSVNYSTFDETATVSDNDYTALSGTLVFAPGQTEKQIQVSITGDTKVEPDETFGVRLTEPVGATIATGEAQGKILDDSDAAPTLRIVDSRPQNPDDVLVTEGNSGTRDAVFTVELTGKVSGPFSVEYTTNDGTAKAGSDFTRTTGTLNFGANERTKEIRVPILGDTVFEVDENFTVVLTNPTNGVTLAKAEGIGTIANDETTPALTIDNVTVIEGNDGVKEAVFTVKLSPGQREAPVTVKYQTVNQSATAGEDYGALPETTLTFAPDETEKTITVPIFGDTKGEIDETFIVRLSEPTGGAVISKADGIGTITNDDASLTIDDVTVVEGSGGTRNAVFTVTLKPLPGTTFPVRVDYATQNGSAPDAATAESGDYSAVSGTIEFAAGETTKRIVVPIGTDSALEANENFRVVLSNSRGADGAPSVDIGKAVGTGTITNDDASVSVANISVAEGDTGTKEAVFTVTLSRASNVPVTVTYATRNGTATAGTDYEAANGSITFAPGETSKAVPVTLLGDQVFEPAETFFLDLTSDLAGGATGNENAGQATITNDDARPVLRIGSAEVVEGNSGTSTLRYTVTLTGETTETVSVRVKTVDGTATSANAPARTSPLATRQSPLHPEKRRRLSTCR
jgi:hypothetical protein